MKNVSIRGRRAVALNGCDVSLYYAVNGRRLRRTVRVSPPVRFDEVIVALVDEVSAPPVRQFGWPSTPRGLARFTYHRLREAHASLSAPLRDAKPMFDVRPLEPNNVAHLMHDIVPLCLFAGEVLDGNLKCVFRDVGAPFRPFLEVFEIDPIFTTRRVEGEIVRVRGSREMAVHDLFLTVDCPQFILLPHVYDRFSFSTPTRAPRLFLARRDARALLNHAEVEHMLAAHGYETIYMEDYPVREQLALAAQAQHVVGIHGAALSMLLVSRGLKSVIELLPPHVYHDIYAMCLDWRVERYITLIPEFDEAVQQSGWTALLDYKQRPFAVDLVALERALDEAHA